MKKMFLISGVVVFLCASACEKNTVNQANNKIKKDSIDTKIGGSTTGPGVGSSGTGTNELKEKP